MPESPACRNSRPIDRTGFRGAGIHMVAKSVADSRGKKALGRTAKEMPSSDKEGKGQRPFGDLEIDLDRVLELSQGLEPTWSSGPEMINVPAGHRLTDLSRASPSRFALVASPRARTGLSAQRGAEPLATVDHASSAVACGRGLD